MTSALRLDTLPPDLIRMLIRIADDGIESLRVISPTWYDIVLEYCEHCRICPLERVYLTRGSDPEYYDYRFWAIEGTCGLQKLGLTKEEKFIIFCVMIVILVNFIGSYFAGQEIYREWGIWAYLMRTIATLPAYILYKLGIYLSRESDQLNCLAPSEIKALNHRWVRHTRFYKYFSHIELLVIDKFTFRAVLDQAIATLDNVRVKKVEVHQWMCCKEIMKRIVAMTRKNCVRHISIVADRCDQDSLGPFLAKIVRLGVTINVYETDNRSNTYFKRPMEFWDAMKSNLEESGVSVAITARFNEKVGPDRVKTCLSCKPAAMGEYHCDSDTARGFYLDD